MRFDFRINFEPGYLPFALNPTHNLTKNDETDDAHIYSTSAKLASLKPQIFAKTYAC